MPASRSQLLSQLEFRWQVMIRPRLEGLTDDEYVWEPAPGCWSVRPAEIGHFVVEGQWYGGLRHEVSPPPFTTIAWRLCHVGSGLAMRANHHFGDCSLTWENFWEQESVPGTAAEGLAFVDRAFAAWHDGILSRPEEFIDEKSEGPPGTRDGRFPFADVIQHVNAEVLGHGAEMCLLRDLFRAMA